MAEYVGFLPVEIKHLKNDSSFPKDECDFEEITSRFHGPRDYALIAYKP